MKKLLLIASLFCFKQLNAQCSLTITGNTVICSGTTTTLTASGATNYTWMPSSANTATIAVTPTVTTIYTVTGTTGTCTATNTVAVTVNNNPVLSFNTIPACDQTPICINNTTAAQGTFTNWAWDFGDGTTGAIAAPPCHTYSVAGVYTVVLTATTTAGCSGSVTATAIVHPNPVANGSFTEACLGDTTFFHDGSLVINPTGINDVITNWKWDFGDGQQSNLPSPKHIYATCGVYSISFTATTNFNCSNTLSGTDTVFCLPQVMAPPSFSICPGTAVSSVQTTFSTTCSSPAWGVPMTVWFTNNPNPKTFTHTGIPLVDTTGFNSIPNYNAINSNLTCGLLVDTIYGYAITVYNNQIGCIGDAATFTISVYPTPTVTPINNISVCANQTVCVSAFTGCPAFTTYTWTTVNTTIGLPSTGTGNICFTGMNNSANAVNLSPISVTPIANGCVGPASTFTISVYPYPTLSVTTNHPILCLGLPDTLIASGATTYTWNTSQTGASIVVTPATPTVNYTLTGSNHGCISTYTFTETPAICEGINTFSNNVTITLYPNPNNGNFVIETNLNDKQTMQILDVTGKLILQQTINGKANIDASNLDNGIYFVQMNTNEGLFTKKIIVQR